MKEGLSTNAVLGDGEVRKLAPLLLRIVFTSDGDGDIEVAELDGKVELEVGVSGDLEGLFLVTLALEELGNAVSLVDGDLREDLGGETKVTSQDSCLVVDDRNVKTVAHDVERLVRQVHSTLLGHVSQQVHHTFFFFFLSTKRKTKKKMKRGRQTDRGDRW